MKPGLSLLAALLIATPAFSGTIVYDVILLGSLESPPTGSPGTGFGTVTIDSVANTMVLNIAFSGLLAPTTASHIHCCTASPDTGTAGVATTTPSFTGFPLGVTAGTFTSTLDLTLASSYNPAFVSAEGGITGAETALLAGIAAGDAYWNIHSTVDPGGEIRGFLVAETPEPGTFILAGAALLAGCLSRRRKIS